MGPNRFAPPLTCSVQPAGHLIDLTLFVLIVDHFAVMEEKPEVKSEELNLTEEKSQNDVTGEQKTALSWTNVLFPDALLPHPQQP